MNMSNYLETRTHNNINELRKQKKRSKYMKNVNFKRNYTISYNMMECKSKHRKMESIVET